MNYFKKILIIACVAIIFDSCEKFSHFQVDPNHPTQADPSLELTNIEQTAFYYNINRSAPLACRYLIYTEDADGNQYYAWQRASMNYSYISQVVKMQQEAERVNSPNYRYIGKFLADYYIIGMTLQFGDIPYSQMMQLMENPGNTDTSAMQPVYDTQHDVYLGVLNDLKIASDSLSLTAEPIAGDVVFGGNITKWKQLINAFSLRVLMSLSKKTGDATLNVQGRFNDIVSDPAAYPLMGSNNDNGQLTFYNVQGSQYPYYNNSSEKTDYYMDSSFVTMLQQLKDPRLFTFARPTSNAMDIAIADSIPTKTLYHDFTAYAGGWGSGPIAYNTSKIQAGALSQINKRYAFDPVNEPAVLMGYSEQEFLLAEAAVRGWISGNASTYYMNGIQASLSGIEASLALSGNDSTTYTDADIQTYMNQPSVALQSSTAIQQIITQKYISMFMNVGWQPFYEQRRTGFPIFTVNGGGVVNQANGQPAIPKRWMYPTDEYQNNATNVQAAVQRQYPNGDDINGVMWLLQ